MAKGRKPAIEISGRPSVSGGRNPKSPLDDLGKWVAKQGAKKIKKAEIQHIKRYARGIGWANSYEKTGLEKIIDKRVGVPPLKGTKRTNKVVAATVGKTPKAKLAGAKLNMYYKKQDKYARTYGDSFGPHDRFFKNMETGRAPRKEFNKRANAAWNAEVEIGRKQGQAGNKAAVKVLRPKSKRRVPKKK